MSTAARIMARTEADHTIANISDAELARAFRRRREMRYEAAEARIRKACFESLQDPATTHDRAMQLTCWLREHLQSLPELPGCADLQGDPAVDMVADYLWWMEQMLREHRNQPPISRQP